MKKPFNWEDYNEEMKRDPGFDLFSKFSFDHLSQAECNEIGWKMKQAGEALHAEAKAIRAELKARRRSRLNVIDGGGVTERETIVKKLRMAALEAESTHTVVQLTVNNKTFNAIIDIDNASDEELRLGYWVKIVQPCGLRGASNQRDLVEEATQ